MKSLRRGTKCKCGDFPVWQRKNPDFKVMQIYNFNNSEEPLTVWTYPKSQEETHTHNKKHLKLWVSLLTSASGKAWAYFSGFCHEVQPGILDIWVKQTWRDCKEQRRRWPAEGLEIGDQETAVVQPKMSPAKACWPVVSSGASPRDPREQGAAQLGRIHVCVRAAVLQRTPHRPAPHSQPH